MGFRFYKRIRILPGLSINLGKKGASVSVGPRGAKMTFGPNGTRTSIGIPGTGIRYEKRYGKSSSNRNMASGGGSSGGLVLALLMAVISIFSFLYFQVDKSGVAALVMILSGVGAIISFIAVAVNAQIGNLYVLLCFPATVCA